MGIGDKIVLYSIAPWHNSFTYWEGNELKYERFTAGSERYNKVRGDFLEDLIAHLKKTVGLTNLISELMKEDFPRRHLT